MSPTFPSGHYYSPIPDIDALDPSRFADAFAHALTLDSQSILSFAEKVFAYSDEFAQVVESQASGYKWCNSQFPPADALAYYGLLRLLKPARIVEIGAGYSTHVALAAVKRNRKGQLTCVDPYPRDFLKSLNEVLLIDRKLQEVPDDLFRSLGSGDVLFVDSSHQVKCQSDVLDVFFRVLDLLRVGTFVHFHDIFWPDDYPYFWMRDRGVFFNEQYFLLAFLKGNPMYDCRLANAYVVRKHRELYETWVSGIHLPRSECFVNLEHGFIKAGSFWLEKLE